MAAGIGSDHESTTVEEARARRRLGMLVQVREGSSAQNLDTILPLLASGELDESWCLVTDDIFPTDLRRRGHLDGLLKRLVAGGVPPAVAIRHASFVPARHYGLADRGGIAPAWRADLVAGRRFAHFRVQTVIKDGRVAARDGRCLEQRGPRSVDVCEHDAPGPRSNRKAALPASSGRELPGDRDRPRPDRDPARHAERAPAGRMNGVSTRSATCS